MKLSYALALFLVCLLQAEGTFKITRIGGYSGVTLNGKPYFRIPRNEEESTSSKERDGNRYANNLEMEDKNAWINSPKSFDTSQYDEYDTIIKRNYAWNLLRRNPQKKLNQKRRSYFRLSIRPEKIISQQ